MPDFIVGLMVVGELRREYGLTDGIAAAVRLGLSVSQMAVRSQRKLSAATVSEARTDGGVGCRRSFGHLARRSSTMPGSSPSLILAVRSRARADGKTSEMIRRRGRSRGTEINSANS